MNKEEYWIALVNKNPSFQGEFVKISTRSLKAIVFQAFERGQQNAVKCDKNDSKKSSYDIFSELLGKKHY